MDIYCPHCGEPWDTAAFHDVPASPSDPWYRSSIGNGLETRGAGSELQQFYTSARALQLFRHYGCQLFGVACNEEPNERAAHVAAAALATAGDDIDAAAAACDDFI